jgi:hypothetical protein
MDMTMGRELAEVQAKGLPDCESLETMPLSTLLYYAVTGGFLGGVHVPRAGMSRTRDDGGFPVVV